MANTKVGLAYRSTRRNWVKLWTHEWLRGTSRFELKPWQRSAFIDLLAMAGDSKVPGKVCAGLDADGTILAFPGSYLAGQLTIDEDELTEALALFENQGRVTVTEDKRGNPIITLNSWERYQSEYHRQKSYRSNSSEVTRKVTTETPVKLPVEGEVEGDGEVEGEKPFSVFWDLFPRKVGKEQAKALWRKMKDVEKDAAMDGLRLWRQTEQWQRDDGKYVPYASTFLRQKRWADEPWNGAFAEKSA